MCSLIFFPRRGLVLGTNTLAMLSNTVGLAGVMSLSLALEINFNTTSHGRFSYQLFLF